MAYDDEDVGYDEAPVEEPAYSRDTSVIPDDPAAEEDYQPEDWVRQLLDETRAQFGIGQQAQPAIPDDDEVPAEAPQRFAPDEVPDEIPPQRFAPAPATDEGAERSKGAFTPNANFIPGAPESPNVEDRRTAAAPAGGGGGLGRGAPTGPETPAFALPDFNAPPSPGSVPQQGLGEQGAGLGDPNAPPKPVAAEKPGLAQQFMRYLFGAEADPKHEQRVEQVRANNPNMNSDDARLEALRLAQKEGDGPGALQSERAKYTALRASAAAAFDHGRDIEKAVTLWNKANEHVPNGQRVITTPNGTGVTMILPVPAGALEQGQARSINLTGDQFRELLHKPVGEFDHMIERGLYKNASDLSRTPGMPLSALGGDPNAAPGYKPPTPVEQQPLRPGEKIVQPSGPTPIPGLNVAPRGQMPYPGQVTQAEYDRRQQSLAEQRGETANRVPVDPTGGYRSRLDPTEQLGRARQAYNTGNYSAAGKNFNEAATSLSNTEQRMLVTINPDGSSKLTSTAGTGKSQTQDLDRAATRDLINMGPNQAWHSIYNPSPENPPVRGTNRMLTDYGTPPGKGADVGYETTTRPGSGPRALTPQEYRDQFTPERMRELGYRSPGDQAATKEKEYGTRAAAMFPNDPAKQAQATELMRANDAKAQSRARDQDLRERALTAPRAPSPRASAQSAPAKSAPAQSAFAQPAPRSGGGGGHRRRRHHQ